MEKSDIKALYEKINFNNINLDTFISAYVIYDHKYYLTEEEYSNFSYLFKIFNSKYINQKNTALEIINDLIKLKENRILSFDYYWDSVINSKVVEIIDDSCMRRIITEHLVPLYYILYNKKVSLKFSSLIKEIILGIDNGIEFYTNQYDFPKEEKYRYFLPKLDENDIDYLIEKYISSEIRNPNHLKALKSHKNNKETYIIRPERIVEIEKAYIDCFNDPHIQSYKTKGPEIEIGISEDIDQPFFNGMHNGHLSFVSSKKFIDDNLSNDNFINILIFSLKLVDMQFRINGLYNPYNEDGLVILENRTIHQYGGMDFELNQSKINVHFSVVARYLENINCSIERFIEYFVTNVFSKNYGAQGFNVELSVNGKYKLRCEHLCDEMQSFIKQYDSHFRVGNVSNELVRHLNFQGYSNIKSKVSNKYIAVNKKNKDIYRIFNLLFKENSLLIDNKKKDVSNIPFAGMIQYFRMSLDDFYEYQIPEINFLINKKVLRTEDNIIRFNNQNLVIILKELYDHGYISCKHLKSDFEESIAYLLEIGCVKAESNLLSSIESDYFDYYLSDKKYSGNPSIRNKYEHGASFVTEEEALLDYYVVLRLFTILILKVIEEFELRLLDNSKLKN